MSFRNTLILALIVAALGAYLWLVERPAVESESKKSNVLDVEPERVSRVELVSADGTVELVREAETWRMVKPVEARADQRAVESLVRVAAEAEQKKKIDAVQDFEQYGLAAPKVVVRMTRDDGTALPALAIGKNAPIGFNAYLRRGDENAVLLAPASVASGLEKRADDLRDKTVIAMSEDEIESITIAPRGGERVVLAKSGSDWAITEPIKAKADTTAVRGLLGSMRGLRAAGFVDESGDQVRASHGLTPPQLSVSLQAKTDPKERGLNLGKEIGDESKKQLYVESVPAGRIFVVGGQTLQSLSKSAQDLRDKTVVAVDDQRLARVELVRAGEKAPLVFEKDGAMWKLSGEGGAKAKELLVKRFIDDVRALKGDTIVSESGDRAAFGLDQPLVEVALFAKEDAPLGRILLGAHGEGAQRKYYAAAADGGPVFELRDYVFRRLDKPREEFTELALPASPPAGVGEAEDLDEDDSDQAGAPDEEHGSLNVAP